MPVDGKTKYWVSYSVTAGLIYLILLIVSVRDFQQDPSAWAAPFFLIFASTGSSMLGIVYGKGFIPRSLGFYVLFLDVVGLTISYG